MRLPHLGPRPRETPQASVAIDADPDAIAGAAQTIWSGAFEHFHSDGTITDDVVLWQGDRIIGKHATGDVTVTDSGIEVRVQPKNRIIRALAGQVRIAVERQPDSPTSHVGLYADLACVNAVAKYLKLGDPTGKIYETLQTIKDTAEQYALDKAA